MRAWMCLLRAVGCIVGIAGSMFFAVPSAQGQATCSVPGAATVYAAGFEPPTFSAGPLNGQDGWATFGGGAVQASVALTGTQSLRFSTPTGGNHSAERPLSVPVGPQTQAFSFSCDMLFESGDSQAGIVIYGDTGFIAQLVRVAGGGYQLGNTNSNTPPQAFADGAWHHLELVLNFQTMTMSGSVDGTALGTLPINNAVAPTMITTMDVRSQAALVATVVYFDNPTVCVTRLACCDSSTGACMLLSVCPSGFTLPPGGGAVCSPNPCPQGACCDLQTLACNPTGPLGCSGPNLSFRGIGSACSPTICPKIACCDLTNAACSVTGPNGCPGAGQFILPNTTCTPNICPQGACCDLATLACTFTGPLGCPAATSQFLSAPSTCTPTVCPQGACCNLTSAACTITGPNGCPGPGQTFRGITTTCTPIICPQGACCDLVSIACVVSGPLGCIGSNVAFQAAMTCATAVCPQGACCDLTSAACTVTGPNGCLGPGQTFRGITTTCTPTICPQGACCDLVSVACAVTGPLGCIGSNVAFQAATTCATAVCPQGACCDLVSAACAITGPNACTGPNLSFRGLNSTCATANCPQGACCDLVSAACGVTGPNGCIGSNLSFRIGTTCATTVCPQGACCDLVSAACGVTGPNGCIGADLSFRGINSACATANCPQGACCDLQTAACAVTGPRGCVNTGLLFMPVGSVCVPNTCPRPTACCNLLTGVCSVSPATVPCAAASVAATPATSTCTPYPCAAVLAAGVVACEDCTYFNGPFDGRDGQLSHLGGASPHGSKAADDFYLCENFVYDLKTFSATIFTTTFPGLVKPRGEIWTDCGGCPGTLLYTFDNPSVLETGTDIGPAFDGRPLRVVHVTFDVTRETLQTNKNIVLRGGIYWLSIYGQSDNLGPSMGMFDVTYWGSTGGTSHVIKGKPAHKIDGNAGNAYNVFTFPSGCGPAAWHSVSDDCCIGCTDLNFSFCTTPCKVLIDNGAARVQSGGLPNGSTSQFATGSGSPMETRSADDFLTPPCQFYNICYVEACVLTNCPTFEGIFEIYGNNCNKPSYALGGQPAGNLQWTATKIVPLGAAYTSVIDGKTVFGYRLEFHDLNFGLNPGFQWWISVGVRYSFSINERAYFCFNQYCDSRCPIKYNEGRVLTASTLDAEAAALGCVSPAPVVGCNGWAKTGNDFSFLIAGDGLTTPGPINGGPGNTTACAADFNSDGSLTPQDVFDYLNSFFAGCP